MSAINLIDGFLRQHNGGISVQIVYPGSVPLTQFFNQTVSGDYAAKGIGMFGIGNGVIDFTNQIPAGATIEKAFLYWDVVRDLEVNANPNGTLNGIAITGQLLGTTIPGRIVDGYRADVTGIANTTLNTLANFPKSVTAPFSAAEGATLIIVYSRSDLPCRTVIINNGIQVFIDDTVTTIIQNFTAVGSSVQAKTHYIVGNGAGANSAIFNGSIVAGPDAFIGAEGLYWDTLYADVSTLVNAGDMIATAAIQSIGGFNLAWLAQVFSVTSGVCQVRGIRFFSV